MKNTIEYYKSIGWVNVDDLQMQKAINDHIFLMVNCVELPNGLYVVQGEKIDVFNYLSKYSDIVLGYYSSIEEFEQTYENGIIRNGVFAEMIIESVGFGSTSYEEDDVVENNIEDIMIDAIAYLENNV